MNRLAKFVMAMPALLLAPFGVAKPGNAAAPPLMGETAAWEAARSAGTPEALQAFIARYPQGRLLEDAFGLLVQGEIEAARSEARSAPSEIQIGQSEPEVLERNFDLGVSRRQENLGDDARGATPY